MIKLQNLCVAYKGRLVLKNIYAQINPGDFIIVVGANGAGKTTLLNALAGKVNLSEGAIMVEDQPLKKENAAMISRVHQNPLQGTASSLLVKENLALALYRYRSVTFRNALGALYGSPLLSRVEHHFPGTHILDQRIDSLSGGQRQLLSFLMATAQPIELLLLDEPTAALDPRATKIMMTAVQELSEQKKVGIVLITHDSAIANTFGTALWVLSDGMLVKKIEPEEKKSLSLHAIEMIMHGEEIGKVI